MWRYLPQRCQLQSTPLRRVAMACCCLLWGLCWMSGTRLNFRITALRVAGRQCLYRATTLFLSSPLCVCSLALCVSKGSTNTEPHSSSLPSITALPHSLSTLICFSSACSLKPAAWTICLPSVKKRCCSGTIFFSDTELVLWQFKHNELVEVEVLAPNQPQNRLAGEELSQTRRGRNIYVGPSLISPVLLLLSLLRKSNSAVEPCV